MREEAEAAARRGEALGKEVETLSAERADLRAQVPHSDLSRCVWAKQVGEPGRFSAPNLTALCRTLSMST